MARQKKERKLVHGVGINDADYVVLPSVNGKQVWCPFYKTWLNMLSRCYSKADHARRPTNISCSTCDEWLTFSNFKAWMQKQDWQGKDLDKDLLIPGNKEYRPDACIFVSRSINLFATESTSRRGNYPIGVSLNKNAKKYQAFCSNPTIKKRESLGYFNCPNEAHKAWRKRKHEIAIQLANQQSDQRLSQALRTRYLDQAEASI